MDLDSTGFESINGVRFDRTRVLVGYHIAEALVMLESLPEMDAGCSDTHSATHAALLSLGLTDPERAATGLVNALSRGGISDTLKRMKLRDVLNGLAALHQTDAKVDDEWKAEEEER